MISLHAVVGVSLVALGMVLTPRPNMIYLSSRSISQGRRAGLVSLAGVATGFLVYLAAATLGLTAVFVAVPAAFSAMKIAGALYLGYLAWQILKPGGTSVFEPRVLAPHSHARLYGMGLLTNLLNPKIALMYLALIPQFVEASRGPVWQQALLLGGVQIVIAVTVNGLIVVGAAGVSRFVTTRPRWATIQKWAAGTLLGTFAVRTATS